jgi:predicted ribosomally synthesized peptide with nif11-like leader
MDKKLLNQEELLEKLEDAMTTEEVAEIMAEAGMPMNQEEIALAQAEAELDEEDLEEVTGGGFVSTVVVIAKTIAAIKAGVEAVIWLGKLSGKAYKTAKNWLKKNGYI